METTEPKDQALTREDIQRLEAMFHQSAQEMYVLVHLIELGLFGLYQKTKDYKARKFIRHLARPIRAPKYIPKMYFVRLIIKNYDPEQRKLTPEKLMKRTHKQLVQIAVNFARMFGSPRIMLKI